MKLGNKMASTVLSFSCQLFSSKTRKPLSFFFPRKALYIASMGYEKELIAARLCQKVQKALLQSDVQSKSDKSPVTVADYGWAIKSGTKSTGSEGDNGPAWAPLHDSYMLTSSKLKDWDKLPENNAGDDMGDQMSRDSSSDED